MSDINDINFHTSSGVLITLTPRFVIIGGNARRYHHAEFWLSEATGEYDVAITWYQGVGYSRGTTYEKVKGFSGNLVFRPSHFGWRIADYYSEAPHGTVLFFDTFCEECGDYFAENSPKGKAEEALNDHFAQTGHVARLYYSEGSY